MKKLIRNLGIILLAIYLLFTALSFHSSYSAEHALWKLDHTFSYLAPRLESTTDFTIDQLAKKYDAFASSYKAMVYAQEARIKIGDLYALRKNYAQARKDYQKAIGSDNNASAQAQFKIAKTYELEGQWDQALAIYKKIVKDYPLTESGFFTPIYLATHAYSEGQQTYSYSDALDFYQKMVTDHPKSKLQYDALRMTAICELNLKNWSATIKTLGRIMLEYPSGKNLKESISAINMLAVTKEHNYDEAINIYDQFMKKYPHFAGNIVLKKMIKDLQVLKAKNLVVQVAPKPSPAPSK